MPQKKSAALKPEASQLTPSLASSKKQKDCCMTGQAREKNERTSEEKSVQRKKGPITRITIKYDVGFSNQLFLRGTGADLSWEKGILLKNTQTDEWVWETSIPFTSCEFKVLINDQEYEVGENHLLSSGASIQYTPKFYAII